MRRQPAQMPMLAAACASPLHSASCAVDKSINRRAYASVYVRIRPYQNDASALGDLGALSWLAGMPALVCAGLESSTSLNFVGDSRRMRAYALGATGDRSINSCADSRRLRAYTRAWSINPALTFHFLEYTKVSMISVNIGSMACCLMAPWHQWNPW